MTPEQEARTLAKHVYVELNGEVPPNRDLYAEAQAFLKSLPNDTARDLERCTEAIYNRLMTYKTNGLIFSRLCKLPFEEEIIEEALAGLLNIPLITFRKVGSGERYFILEP